MLLDVVYEEKLEGAEGRAADLTYVTQHFKNLRGLLWAPLFPLFCPLLVARVSYGAKLSTALIIYAVLVAATIAWTVWMKSWYERKYGNVQRSSIAKVETRPGLFWVRILSISGLIAICYFRGGSHNIGIVWLWITCDGILINRCFEAAPRNRLIRLRRNLYTAATVIFYAAMMRGVAAPLHVVPYLVGSSGFCLLGLYDHWLLNHLLRPIPLEARND